VRFREQAFPEALPIELPGQGQQVGFLRFAAGDRGLVTQGGTEAPGLWELRETVASLYNALYRRGMPSQYSADNVSIDAGAVNIVNPTNAYATFTITGSGGTLNVTGTKPWEAKNVGAAEAEAQYTLGAWVYNDVNGPFDVLTAGPFSVTGENDDTDQHSFDKELLL